MTLGFIILGLLTYGSMTGYDLKNFFKQSINFFWSAELSQIYRELAKLEKQGYVSHQVLYQEGKPNKKVYSLTKYGEKEFLRWLKEFPQDLNGPARNEFLVRIFFGSRLPETELSGVLERYLGEKQAELKAYKEIEAKIQDLAKVPELAREVFYQHLTVRRGLLYAEAEISWASECLAELSMLENHQVKLDSGGI